MNPAQARRPVPLPLKLLFAIVGVSLIFWSLFRLGGSMSPTQLHDTMAPLMFGGLIVFLVIGYPAAFSLGAVGLFFAIFGIRFGLFEPAFLGNMTYQLFSVVSNDLLLAIPFFTFMGAILERCGLAEDLLDSIGQLFGPVRGGLSYAVIIVGAILGAITGTVAASVIAMGVISLPVMMRYGYDMRHATGVIAASGTITQLIPPSLVLVVLADVLQRPVGDMYLGATIPSIIQVALFMGWVLILSFWKPEQVPPLPLEARTLRGWPLLKKALWGIIPSMGLIFMVLGTMFMGLATPTEAGAMGAVGAIALALAKNTFSWKLMNEAASSTMRITAMVVFILIGARTFSLVFQGVGGGEWIAGLLKGLPGGQTGFLIFISAFVFVIAFFLDFFEIAFIIIPLVAPVAEKLGIDLIWFGVLLCANIQTSFMHPPFGFALFYLRGIAPPEVKSSDIYWGSIPWIIMQLMLVAILIIWPGTVTSMLTSTKDIDVSKATFTLPPLNMGAGSSPFGAAPSFGSPPPGLGGLPPGLSPPPGLTPPPAMPSMPTVPAIPTPAPISVTPPPVEVPAAAPVAPAMPAPAAAPGEVQGSVPAPPAIIDATSPPQTDDLKPKQ